MNTSNSHTIQFYSFEPPTALHICGGFFLGGYKLRRMLLVLFCCVLPCATLADIASTTYVDNTKVDISATANQTMAGTYTVSGTLVVPTPPLPSAE